MSEYQLYCFAQSGNAYKAALALQLAGASWQPRFVDFFNGETRTPAYRAINVMGEVPILEYQDGAAGTVRLTQSGVILDVLSNRLNRFGPKDEAQRREVLRWILFDNHKLTSYTATYRFMIRFANAGVTPVTDFFRARMLGAFKVLEAHLAEGRRFVAGDALTTADLSLCGYLFFNDEFGVDWKDFPSIDTWLGHIRAMPGWKHPYDLMPGHPLPAKPAA